MAKKRSKKYNPRKNLNIRIDPVKEYICFAWVPGMKAPDTFVRQTGDELTVPANLHNHIMQHAQHWTCSCLVVCRPQHLDPYIRIIDVSSKGPMTHRDIADDLNDVHKAAIAELNDDHVICASWILVPKYLKDEDLLEDTVIDKVMSQLGVWSLKSGYEWRRG